MNKVFIFTVPEEKKRIKNAEVEKCILSMAQGNTSSMGELYGLIITDVYAFALSKLGNKEDAEDIAQDAFVQIYKNAPLYKAQGKPMAWVITLEYNLIRRRFVLKSRTVEFEDSIDAKADETDFTDKVIANEFVRELLKHLDPDEREVISLHIVSGLKHREISKILGKPLSTVLSKYNRAMKKLQEIAKEGK